MAEPSLLFIFSELPSFIDVSFDLGGLVLDQWDGLLDNALEELRVFQMRSPEYAMHMDMLFGALTQNVLDSMALERREFVDGIETLSVSSSFEGVVNDGVIVKQTEDGTRESINFFQWPQYTLLMLYTILVRAYELRPRVILYEPEAIVPHVVPDVMDASYYATTSDVRGLSDQKQTLVDRHAIQGEVRDPAQALTDRRVELVPPGRRGGMWVVFTRKYGFFAFVVFTIGWWIVMRGAPPDRLNPDGPVEVVIKASEGVGHALIQYTRRIDALYNLGCGVLRLTCHHTNLQQRYDFICETLRQAGREINPANIRETFDSFMGLVRTEPR